MRPPRGSPRRPGDRPGRVPARREGTENTDRAVQITLVGVKTSVWYPQRPCVPQLRPHPLQLGLQEQQHGAFQGCFGTHGETLETLKARKHMLFYTVLNNVPEAAQLGP